MRSSVVFLVTKVMLDKFGDRSSDSKPLKFPSSPVVCPWKDLGTDMVKYKMSLADTLTMAMIPLAKLISTDLNGKLSSVLCILTVLFELAKKPPV